MKTLFDTLVGLVVRFKKLILFVAFGAFGVFLVSSFTFLFTEYLHWWYFYSFLVATAITWTILFFCHSHVTFVGHSKEGYMKKYAIFMSTYLMVFFVNAGIVYTLTSHVGVPYVISIVTASIITAGINFFLSSRYVYTD